MLSGDKTRRQKDLYALGFEGEEIDILESMNNEFTMGKQCQRVTMLHLKILSELKDSDLIESWLKTFMKRAELLLEYHEMAEGKLGNNRNIEDQINAASHTPESYKGHGPVPPKRAWLQKRWGVLNDAIMDAINAGYQPNQQWITERKQISDKLKGINDNGRKEV